LRKFPRLCEENYESLIKKFKNLSKEYTKWKFSESGNDFGVTLAKIFCEMQEETINRLNRSVHNLYLTLLKMIGVYPKPCTPSNGIAIIEAARNSIVTYVKSGTKISAESGNDSVVFETKDDVFVIENSIKSIFITDSFEEKIIKVFDSESNFNRFKLFDFGQYKNLQFKAIYLSDKHLFDSKEINLTFHFKNKFSKESEKKLNEFFLSSVWQYFDGTNWENIKNVKKTNDNLINITFEGKICDYKILNKISKFLRILPLDNTEISISDILCSSSTKIVYPNILSGESEIHGKKLMPFDENYVMYDTFNINCDEAFTKPEINIELKMDVYFTKIKTNMKNPIKKYRLIMSEMDFTESEPVDISIENVVWEYWKGNAWARLKTSDDCQKFFKANKNRETKTISFECPKDLSKIEIGPIDGFFIRSRITKINNQFNTFANHVVPCIDNISIKYYYKKPKRFDEIIINSDLRWKIVKIEKNSQNITKIFEKKYSGKPTMYVNLLKPISDGIFSVFFDIEKGIFSEKFSTQWEYWAKNQNKNCGWKVLDVIDFTNGFTKSEIIKIFSKKNFEKLNLFGEKGYFLRITCMNKDFSKLSNEPFPILRDIKFNAVKIIQKETKLDEFFSIDAGEKNKVCSLSSKNAYEINVWVNEFSKISSKEQDFLNSYEGKIKTESDKFNILKKVWVKWDRVSNILNSSEKDRVYEVDFKKSQIMFGDGKNGKIPNEQYDESIKIDYSVSEGSKGNIQKESIKDFESVIPSVLKVYNPRPFWGGLDLESIEDAASRTFSSINNGNRIVSIQDFENAILFENRNIFKVKCIPHFDKYNKRSVGTLSIAILPKRPMCGYEKFSSIKEETLEFIKTKSCMNVNDLNIFEVFYIKFFVRLDVVIENFDNYQYVHKNINYKLEKFLHPVTGNFFGSGFDIGKIPNERNLINYIKSVKHLKFINKINIFTKILTEKSSDDISFEDARDLKFVVPVFDKSEIDISM